MKAAARGDVETFRLLRSQSMTNHRDQQGRTWLTHAIANRQTALLTTLLDEAEAYVPHRLAGHGIVTQINPELLSMADHEGTRPLQLARKLELSDVADRIERYCQALIERISQEGTSGEWYQGYNLQTIGHCYFAIGNEELGKANFRQANHPTGDSPGSGPPDSAEVEEFKELEH